MDLYQANPDKLVYKARCEKYAKIISKTIILSGMDAASFGQNAYFYDATEGLLTATILLVAEFCKPEQRHIVSVFKIIQELLAPSGKKGRNQFQQLMELLPNDHKAKWFAGAALNTAEQSMASVMSTALSRLNAFLDSELEQILCIDAFVKRDMELARAVIAYDDVVDGYFDEIKTSLIARFGEPAANGEKVLDLLMIAKYFERMGDHAAEIAKWVLFSITGNKEG